MDIETMKNKALGHSFTLITLVAVSLGAQAQGKISLSTAKDKVSYGMGVDIARNLKKQDVEIDLKLLTRGLEDGLSGKDSLLPEKELRQVMNSFQADVRRKMAENARVAADENRKSGEAFLAENKTKEGVTTLASGVQYRILKAGDGPKPGIGDIVQCNYRGTLLNGTEFDATEPGKPANLKVSALIPGWKEALTLMPVGSTWQIVIPSHLAYGPRGSGVDIGPNETLIFDIEVVGINPK